MGAPTTYISPEEADKLIKKYHEEELIKKLGEEGYKQYKIEEEINKPRQHWLELGHMDNDDDSIPDILKNIISNLENQVFTFCLEDKYRAGGIHMVAGKGSGKSWTLGRNLAYGDVIRYIPTILIDPEGKTIDYFLDKINQLPSAERDAIIARIRYIDMLGRDGYVTPFPLLCHQSNDDTLQDIAARYIDAIEITDPSLKEGAPVQGMNSVRPLGTSLGMLLYALGLQITEADELLQNISKYEERLENLAKHDSTGSLSRAIKYVKEFGKSQSMIFRGKSTNFVLDPINRAIFSASQQGIDWGEVVSKRLVVLIDISNKRPNRFIQAFKMYWVLESLVSYIRETGHTRKTPISVIIDEISTMYNAADNVVSDALNNLSNVVARNNNMWLTLAHQEMYQFEEMAQNTLMSMDFQILGRTSSSETALMYARLYNPVDPNRVKRTENVWVSSPDNFDAYGPYGENLTFHNGTKHKVIEQKPIPYTFEEQHLLNSYKYRNLKQHEYYGRFPPFNTVEKISTLPYNPRADIDTEKIRELKMKLAKQYGRKIEDIEAEIEARLNPPDPPAKIKEYEAPRNDIQIDLAADITESTSLDEICRLYEAAVKNKDYDRAGAILSKQVEIGLASEKIRASWSIQLKETGLFNDYFEQEEKNDLWEEI